MAEPLYRFGEWMVPGWPNCRSASTGMEPTA
jgi:hypothetical protein